jgi:hypothetical protein
MTTNGKLDHREIFSNWTNNVLVWIAELFAGPFPVIVIYTILAVYLIAMVGWGYHAIHPDVQ